MRLGPPRHLADATQEFRTTDQVTIVVLFQIMDCAGARRELTLWNEVHRRPGFSVLGILVDPSSSPAADDAVLAGAGLEYDVLRRTPVGTVDFVRSLGFTATPVVLAFDESDRIRFAGTISDFSNSGVISRALALHFPEG